MFTAVIIRPSADIFVYPIAIKEKVEPMRSYWGKYKSKGFVSYAGYLKKFTTTMWQLGVTDKTSECSLAKDMQ